MEPKERFPPDPFPRKAYRSLRFYANTPNVATFSQIVVSALADEVEITAAVLLKNTKNRTFHPINNGKNVLFLYFRLKPFFFDYSLCPPSSSGVVRPSPAIRASMSWPMISSPANR